MVLQHQIHRHPSEMLLAFHKPFGVISQFGRDGSSNRTLKEFNFPKDVYPLGRLDADSEGLLLLSDEPAVNSQLLDPTQGHPRMYWAQVEGTPSETSLIQLAAGVLVRERRTLPCHVRRFTPPDSVYPREPPIRTRKAIPVSWLELKLVEGKNRQVRRMTAAIGHPTLRLIRVGIGLYPLGTLPPGSWTILDAKDRARVFA